MKLNVRCWINTPFVQQYIHLLMWSDEMVKIKRFHEMLLDALIFLFLKNDSVINKFFFNNQDSFGYFHNIIVLS